MGSQPSRSANKATRRTQEGGWREVGGGIGSGSSEPSTSTSTTPTARPISIPKPLLAPAPMPNTTVPCQYRTGKTLGSGTYAIVKEAIHIKTGKYYACKVINKKLMEGREHMYLRVEPKLNFLRNSSSTRELKSRNT
ncbi:hypothetical protein B0H16DRAFT_1466227 [Mycena metata]|uniref:Protein kinase domain-containing protein n=1 Tax=Mycena metata TaxID=1033252 RepID=A0AAD7I8Q0_9AGAR|nr:hypothetical protein B0H16DRAFT_1466227 [Mycena metata]